ncbi:MAG: sensor histidine kinase [Acidiferrobacterales bacterium]
MDSRIFGIGMSAAESQSAVAAENWKLLRYFNFYRALIACAAAAYALSHARIPPFGESDPQLFFGTSLIYAALAITGIITAWRRWPGFETQAGLFSFLDITLLTLLLHASTGLGSGLGLLLVVSVGGSSLILGRRLTIFFAALATVAVGLEVNWAFLTGGTWITDGYTQAGLLGLGLFATAGLSHTLAERLRASEALAQRRGVDLANLSQINELIIQRMQSGVLVCDQVGHVHMVNKTARDFLDLREPLTGKPLLTDISGSLATQLFDWLSKSSSNHGRQLVTTRAGYTLLPRFVSVGDQQISGVLVFLEDTSILKQQAQQLKMAALARLTASIAHEIRNPLGAIIHAGQLLSESAAQSGEEKRLVRIIEDQSRRMNVIVENVMQLSRRDHVNPVAVNLGSWLKDFVHQFTETSGKPAEIISVVTHGEVEVCVDPDQLSQVIGNLCQNALRHSPPFTGQPLIAFKAAMDPDNRPFLDVIDWGSGVPQEIVDNIFDPFFTTTPKGTGLGLYIARELCEGNGARLDYHPGDGIGSRFRVTFLRAEECGGLRIL